MEDVERKDDNDGWIMIARKASYKNKTTPPVLATTKNTPATLPDYRAVTTLQD
jgi:hypothetical protein